MSLSPKKLCLKYFKNTEISNLEDFCNPILEFYQLSYRADILLDISEIYFNTRDSLLVDPDRAIFAALESWHRLWLEKYTKPYPGQKWRHFKGDLCTIVCTAIDVHFDIDVVVYSDVNNKIYSRHLEEFTEIMESGKPRFVLEYQE